MFCLLGSDAELHFLTHVERGNGGFVIVVLEAIGALRLFAEREGNVDRLHGDSFASRVTMLSVSISRTLDPSRVQSKLRHLLCAR
jgi:hypothetical protein